MSDKGKKTKDGFMDQVVEADRAEDTAVGEVIRAIRAVGIRVET